MARAEVNGISMFYESHGEGDAIVFAHGAGGNHLSWWQQVPHFAKRFRCVTFDHRGFGQTPADDRGWDAFPDDLRALLDSLSIDRAWLVAQSMGGLTCMGFTAAHPARVRGVVMADTVLGIDDEELREVMRAGRRAQTLQAGAYDASLRERRPDVAFLYDSIMALNPPRDPQAGAAAMRGGGATRQTLATLDVPMLFVAGDNDALIAPEAIKLAASFVPGSRYVEIAGSGHSAYFERAEEFNRAVDDFVASA